LIKKKSVNKLDVDTHKGGSSCKRGLGASFYIL